MTRTWGIIIAVIVAASLIGSAVIIRSGLVAIAIAVRDKPIPQWPQQLHLVTGQSKLNLEIANLSVQQAPTTAEANISVDNVRVTVPTTQPMKR